MHPMAEAVKAPLAKLYKRLQCALPAVDFILGCGTVCTAGFYMKLVVQRSFAYLPAHLLHIREHRSEENAATVLARVSWKRLSRRQQSTQSRDICFSKTSSAILYTR